MVGFWQRCGNEVAQFVLYIPDNQYEMKAKGLGNYVIFQDNKPSVFYCKYGFNVTLPEWLTGSPAKVI